MDGLGWHLERSHFQQDEGGVFSTRQRDGVTYADGQSFEWTSRLWADYVRSYGRADPYGFSIPYARRTH